MKAAIWDLDGTVLDSYKVILESVLATLGEADVTVDPSETYKKLIATSVGSFLREFAAQGHDPDALWERYREISTARDGEVALMDGAADALDILSRAGIMNLVYTHKGATARDVLGRLGVLGYFADVLSAEAGLPRKPAPDGINELVSRHGLDKRRTFYIGDRPIDMECAHNAGVFGILYLPPASPAVPTGWETHIVADLREIPNLIT